MRVGFTSYAVLCAIASAGALVIACSSDDGATGVPATGGDAGTVPDGALPDTSTPDSNVLESGDPNDVVFTSAELAMMKTLSPLPAVPADPTNAFADNAKAAELGQRLFFDKAFSGALVLGDDGTNGSLGAAGDTGKVACITCHASKATDDDRAPNNVSRGTNYGTRNALSIINSSFYEWTNWGGRFDSQWSLPLAVVENPAIMNGTRLHVAHVLWDKYKADYDAIFLVPLDARLDPADTNAADLPPSGKPTVAAWDTGTSAADKIIINRIFANYGKAIAAYIRLQVSRNAAFDRYVAGDESAMSQDAKRGLKVFLGKGGCVSCHSGPNLADDDFHSLAVPQTGAHVPASDLGRFQDVNALTGSAFNSAGVYSDDVNTGKLTNLAQDAGMKGQFRTKSLRGLTNAAPYMHSGQFSGLLGVVAFYAAGGGDAGDGEAGVRDPKLHPFALSASDTADLIAFLGTLDGDKLPAALTIDTSRP